MWLSFRHIFTLTLIFFSLHSPNFLFFTLFSRRASMSRCFLLSSFRFRTRSRVIFFSHPLLRISNSRCFVFATGDAHAREAQFVLQHASNRTDSDNPEYSNSLEIGIIYVVHSLKEYLRVQCDEKTNDYIQQTVTNHQNEKKLKKN